MPARDSISQTLSTGPEPSACLACGVWCSRRSRLRAWPRRARPGRTFRRGDRARAAMRAGVGRARGRVRCPRLTRHMGRERRWNRGHRDRSRPHPPWTPALARRRSDRHRPARGRNRRVHGRRPLSPDRACGPARDRRPVRRHHHDRHRERCGRARLLDLRPSAGSGLRARPDMQTTRSGQPHH